MVKPTSEQILTSLGSEGDPELFEGQASDLVAYRLINGGLSSTILKVIDCKDLERDQLTE